jgi:hypothetical protein
MDVNEVVRLALKVGLAFFTLVWFVAIASLFAGNPTAINAVIGIPIAVIPLAIVLYFTREMS